VWVEVLAQWQGLPYEETNNWSYFGHDSEELVANVESLSAPSDASNALCIVWSNDADFVEFMQINSPPYDSGDIPAWTNFINQSLSNHYTAITNLYSKGFRTLVMPKAVDITQAPFYHLPTTNDDWFVRQRITEFNTAFQILLSSTAASISNLTIFVPDTFALFDNVLADAQSYGLTNATDEEGYSTYALIDPNLADKSLNGPGSEYIFWDYLHPTAKFQMHLADLVQLMLSQVTIDSIATANGSNYLASVNVPAGRDGVVQGSTNFVDWPDVQAFESTNTTQTIAVPASGPMEFYRLQFPFNWTWP